jgi:hypothetical protein
MNGDRQLIKAIIDKPLDVRSGQQLSIRCESNKWHPILLRDTDQQGEILVQRRLGAASDDELEGFRKK